MKRFVEGTDRGQSTLFPECLEDWVGEDYPVRVIDVFVEELDLADLGFGGVDPEATDRPSYHPSVLLKLYIYGYLNRVQSSRRLEHEASRNVETMWLTGRLVPDHKTIVDFRKDNGAAIRKVCALHRAVPHDGPADASQRRDRWQQVQGGEQLRQELHARQDGSAHGSD
jgi:transposase